MEEVQGKIPLFKGAAGKRVAGMLMKWLKVDKVNELYDRHSASRGPDFASEILEDIGVEYKLYGGENLEQLPQGAFVVISNHPYGSIDGVMMVDIFGHLRPDFKVMVNGILSRIEAMEDCFIKVTPIGDRRTPPTKDSIHGVRMAMEYVREGHPLGICPSGAVSDLSLKEMCVRDREWQEPVIRLIKKLRVPVVPMRFLDRNSDFYYFLGLIDWRIRLLRLPSEVFNKRGRRTRVKIGKVIPVSQQDAIDDVAVFGDFLRNSVYEITDE